MQIAVPGGNEYIVDVIALKDHMYKFRDVFSNPKILKVFHAAENDILWLQRDFRLYVVGLFDTRAAISTLGTNIGEGLGDVHKELFDLILDKDLQRANWVKRPLEDNLIQYARCDIHLLLYIARLLWNNLKKVDDRDESSKIKMFIDKCEKVSLNTYIRGTVEERIDKSITMKFRQNNFGEKASLLREILMLREERAIELNKNPGFILPQNKIKNALQTSVDALKNLISQCRRGNTQQTSHFHTPSSTSNLVKSPEQEEANRREGLGRRRKPQKTFRAPLIDTREHGAEMLGMNCEPVLLPLQLSFSRRYSERTFTKPPLASLLVTPTSILNKVTEKDKETMTAGHEDEAGREADAEEEEDARRQNLERIRKRQMTLRRIGSLKWRPK